MNQIFLRLELARNSLSPVHILPEIGLSQLYFYAGNLLFFTGDVKDAPLYLICVGAEPLDFLSALAFPSFSLAK